MSWYTVDLRFPEIREQEVESDSISGAINRAIENAGCGWVPEFITIPGDKTLAVVGRCEGCGEWITESDKYAVHEDGVVTHLSECCGES